MILDLLFLPNAQKMGILALNVFFYTIKYQHGTFISDIYHTLEFLPLKYDYFVKIYTFWHTILDVSGPLASTQMCKIVWTGFICDIIHYKT